MKKLKKVMIIFILFCFYLSVFTHILSILKFHIISDRIESILLIPILPIIILTFIIIKGSENITGFKSLKLYANKLSKIKKTLLILIFIYALLYSVLEQVLILFFNMLNKSNDWRGFYFSSPGIILIYYLFYIIYFVI